jgi:hypothetical protein
MASKNGVMANVILSLKLKCSVEEQLKEDGTYYEHNELSPAAPDDHTLWLISSRAVAMFITDIDIDAAGPTSDTNRASASSKPTHSLLPWTNTLLLEEDVTAW